MAKSAAKRLLETQYGELLYGLYKSLYEMLYWTRYHLARRLPNPGLPPHLMATQVKFLGRRVTLQHRRASESDAHAILQCFAQAQYDMPGGTQRVALQRTYEQIVASGRKPLIVDCGANIGASVAWFAERFPAARIVAVEPAPGNCELLRRNTVGLDVEVREAGIAAEDGYAFLVNPTGEDMSFQLSGSGTGTPVPLNSVRTILSDNPDTIPFLLKIDIEGGEKNLFTGDTSAIDSFPLIIMEPHDWMFAGDSISREFFRFHVAAGRDFTMKHENVASIANRPSAKE